VDKTSPSSFVVLRSADVVAFLDILPMTRGHLLVTTREHRGKVADLGAGESREIGESLVGRRERGLLW
jgi:diadenosine tetraphosphate (Ap4A) HIT family hydrolase